VTTVGIVASAWTVVGGPIGARERHLADVSSYVGNSGCPCYAAPDGALIGVLVGGWTAPLHGAEGRYATGLALIVPAERVLELAAGI
jgi:hypothetical protein